MSNHIYNPSHKYIRWYISLIRKSQNRNEIIGYSESHHIFPKSIFGDNKSTVRLTAREHFIAHKILYKIYEIRYGCKHKFTIYMLKAISYMYTRDEIKNNSRMYEECRRAASLAMSGENNPSVKYGFSEEHRRKLSERGKGRPHSAEHKKNLKLAMQKRKQTGIPVFPSGAYEKSLQVRREKSEKFNFRNNLTGEIEICVTLKEMEHKYRLNYGSLRKCRDKYKEGLNVNYKGWFIYVSEV